MRSDFLRHRDKERLVRMTYWLGFLTSLQIYLLVYVNAPFLATLMSEQAVSILFTIGSLAAVFVFIITPMIVTRIGIYKMMLLVISSNFIAVIALGFSRSPIIAALLFIGTIIFTRLIGLGADIFLESGSDDAHTGGIRGIFLTITNIALVFSPLTVGFILGDTTEYWKVYVVSAVVLIPTLFFLVKGFRKFNDPEYNHVPFFKTLRQVWERKNIYRIFMSNIVLRIFYAIMVIYTPLYLHDHLGMPWEKIGIVFTVMLLPFALLELPLGKLADTRFGEKEMLSLGFIWLAVSASILSFITSTNIVVWSLALFATRMGAATIEIMNETYFFKKIDSSDSDIISFFRMIQPIPYIIVPLIMSLLLFIIDLRYIFLIVGIVMLWGLRYSFTIRDTR